MNSSNWIERPEMRPSRLFLRARAEIVGTLAAFRPRYLFAHLVASALPRFAASRGRTVLYRFAGAKIGSGTAIGGPLRLIGGESIEGRLTVGEDVLISTDVTINLDGAVEIGDRCAISPFVRIYTASHGIGPGSRRCLPAVSDRSVVVGAGSWIGLGATLLPGVVIGAGSIVAAGSVVGVDVPANSYVEGNPAVVVRSLPWGDR